MTTTTIPPASAGILVRAYQEADRPFLRTLFLAARKTNWTWLSDTHWRLEDFDAVTLGETILVAEHAGHIAGFASLSTADRFLHNLFIDPPHQRKGVASALLHACYPLCRGKMALKCLIANQPALEFYQQHGWKIISSGIGENGEYYLLHHTTPASR